MTRTTLERLILGMIVLAYLGIGALYAVKTPLWQVPDEPAHYNYIAQVARNGCCPILQPGDWDNDYLNRIKAQKFSPEALGDRLSTIRYEDHQPPLYYLLTAPIYAVSSGNPTILRLFSVLIGAGVVIVAWAVVRTAFPAQPWLALGTAAFVAFLPQHVAMMAGIENDGLAELLVGLALLGSVAYLGASQRRPHPSLLGLVCAAIAVTKITAYPAIVVVGLAVLLCAGREKWSIRQLIVTVAWIAVPIVLIGGLWAVRNLTVYGGFDFLGQAVHDRVVVGQLTTGDYIAGHDMPVPSAHGIGGWLRDAAQTTFDSFWGQFGWMGVLMTGPIYAGLMAFSGFVIIGALIALIRWRRMLSTAQRDTLIIFAVLTLLSFAGLIYWNLKYVQFQGRYLYPALIPIGLFVAVGLSGWIGLIGRRIRYAPWAAVAVLCAFAALDVYILYRIILPALL